jgi:phage portal protein BeeE
MPKGSQHYNAKLNEDLATKILGEIEHRQNLLSEAKNFTLEQIAKRYGVAKQTVADISSGRTWRHIRSPNG